MDAARKTRVACPTRLWSNASPPPPRYCLPSRGTPTIAGVEDAIQRLIRAHDLSLSAFLGESIYNFGELLMHPILDTLDGTPHEWLKKLLFTFNEGNIGKFEALAPLFSREVSVGKVVLRV